MKNFIIAFSTILLCGFLAKAQVGIGTNTPILQALIKGY